MSRDKQKELVKGTLEGIEARMQVQKFRFTLICSYVYYQRTTCHYIPGDRTLHDHSR
jgi:hypothetical protein